MIERLRQRAGTEAAALNEVDRRRCCAPTASRRRRKRWSRRSTTRSRPPKRIGYPVVLKAVSAKLTHKSDMGAVALNLATPVELRTAHERDVGELQDHRLDGMLVGQFVRGGSSWGSGCTATARWD